MGENSHALLSLRTRTLFRRFAVFAVAFALSLLGAGRAVAQEDTRELAKKLFGSGVQYYDKGDFERALQAFQEAYRLAPHPVVRVNMANCYDRMDKPLEAIFHFERFLEENQEGANSKQRREVTAALKRLRKKVGEVRLQVIPDGVSIRIDDAEQRTSPVVDPVMVVAGEHFIDAQLKGYRSVRRSINVAGGETAEIRITMQTLDEPAVAPIPVAGVAPAPTGSRDREAESSQPLIEELAEEPEPEPVVPEAEPIERAAEPDSLGKGTPVLIAGAATALLGVATTVTGVMALGADADYDYLAERETLSDAERADAEDAAARAEDLALATDVLLGATVVGAALTIYFALSGGEESEAQDPPAASAAASAWVGPDGAGIAVTGSL